jgi:rRNA-processing protein FCF1
MEIVVSDTQILIDMDSAGILELAAMSAIHFHTVDLVMAELHRSSFTHPNIDQMVENGDLEVFSFNGKDALSLFSFYSKFAGKTNLTITDCAVLKYAKDNNYRMLTGDRKLRNHAEDEGVMVSGILYLAEHFVDEGLLTGNEMALRLERLMNINPRLPKAIFTDWIKKFRNI